MIASLQLFYPDPTPLARTPLRITQQPPLALHLCFSRLARRPRLGFEYLAVDALVPRPLVLHALSEAALLALHERADALVGLDVFLAEPAAGPQAPGKVHQAAQRAAQGQRVEACKSLPGGRCAHLGVRKCRRALRTVDVSPAFRLELRARPCLETACACF